MTIEKLLTDLIEAVNANTEQLKAAASDRAKIMKQSGAKADSEEKPAKAKAEKASKKSEEPEESDDDEDDADDQFLELTGALKAGKPIKDKEFRNVFAAFLYTNDKKVRAERKDFVVAMLEELGVKEAVQIEEDDREKAIGWLKLVYAGKKVDFNEDEEPAPKSKKAKRNDDDDEDEKPAKKKASAKRSRDDDDDEDDEEEDDDE